jgi:hypothetical protein
MSEPSGDTVGAEAWTMEPMMVSAMDRLDMAADGIAALR